MNPKVYGKLVGVVLLLVGAVGLIQHDLLGMDLSKRHSAVHLLTGGLLAALGFTGAAERLTKNVVLAFGAVYTALGVWGFFTPQILPTLRIFHTDILTNVIHLAVGLLGLVAATMGGKRAATA